MVVQLFLCFLFLHWDIFVVIILYSKMNSLLFMNKQKQKRCSTLILLMHELLWKRDMWSLNFSKQMLFSKRALRIKTTTIIIKMNKKQFANVFHVIVVIFFTLKTFFFPYAVCSVISYSYCLYLYYKKKSFFHHCDYICI